MVEWLRRLLKIVTRLLLWVGLAIVLLLLPLLAILGSEAGSRWLLEQGMGVQRMLTAQYQSGTLLGGLELQNIKIKTSKVELTIGHVLARWSLLSLLKGEMQIERLNAEDIALHVVSPPNNQPVHLPLLILPIRLVIQSSNIQNFQIYPRHATHPFTLSRGEVSGEWWGSRVTLNHVYVKQDDIGEVTLKGKGRLLGDYPLSLKGKLTLWVLQAKQLPTLQVQINRTLANMEILAQSKGALNASLQGQLQPLLHGAPYSASVQWQPFSFPWLIEQQFQTKNGRLYLSGDADGLKTTGSGQLSGLYLPSGQYAWVGETDWHSARIQSLQFKGDMGELKTQGNIDWHSGLAWRIQAEPKNFLLSKKWPQTALALPAMTGVFESSGKASHRQSQMTAKLKLVTGEQWQLQDQSSSWPWNLQNAHTLQLKWQQVRRQLPGLGATHSEAGQLTFLGTAQKYTATLDGDMATERLPSGSWQAVLNGQHQHINVEQFRYKGDAGQFDFGGELDFSHSVSWKGAATLDGFSTEWLTPEWPSTLSGHLTGQGVWGDAQRKIQLDDAYLTGTLKDKPLLIDGALTIVMPPDDAKKWPQIHTPKLTLEWGDNHALVEGGFQQNQLQKGQWDLKAELQLEDLNVFEQRLKGRATGSIALQGEQSEPSITTNLQLEGAEFEDYVVRKLSLSMDIPQLGLSPGHLVLKTEGATVKGIKVDDTTFVAEGTRNAHTLQWNATTGNSHSSGVVEGGFSQSLDWQGEVDSAQFSLPELDWRLSNPFTMKWLNAEHQLQLAPHCWQSQSAQLCADDTQYIGKEGHIHFHLSDFQADRLAAFYPEGLLLKGNLKGEVEGGWIPNHTPQLKGNLYVQDGSVVLGGENPQSALVLPYRYLGVKVDADSEKINLLFNLDSQALGQGEINSVIQQRADESKTLGGTVSLKGLQLSLFQPFFPAISTLVGNLSAEGQLSGTLKQPAYWGSVHLSQGALGLHKLPVNLSDITLQADIQGDAAKLQGALKSGAGTAVLTGDAVWREQPQLNVKVIGQNIELRQPPELMATINPNLSIHVIPNQVDVTGNVKIPMARINVKTLGSDATSLSSDIVLVNPNGDIQLQATQSVSNWLINTNLDVLLGDDVFFHGYGVNGRLMGGVHLRQQGKKGLEASGEVELDKDSRYDAYGQRLKIRRGRLIFAGNLTQPGLDVEAVREIDNEVVGVRVEGRVSTPKVSFFSDDGGLSQEEIVSYLVLGRPLNNTNGENNLSAVAAAIKLGATGGAGLTNKLGEAVGITDLSLDAEGRGDDTQVTVSGYLSPRLYLRYGVGIFTPINTATVRYKISSKLYLEAVSSIDSAIDLFYTLRF